MEKLEKALSQKAKTEISYLFLFNLISTLLIYFLFIQIAESLLVSKEKYKLN